ncbi:ABC transporter ATP-binding protein [Legionella sp. CNM-4043-24]|uniref:ABC transporter ATP-binding protein n=1 Tax=Legionella sp. CNM-4043-24 TaxID=3421646 RepID=UPI00403AAE04
MSSSAIIDVKGLCKQFADKTVVNALSMQVNKGDVFGFLGPNGSGKTTTIRMLCGLLTPDAGSGTCLGYDLLTEARQIKQQVGYMTQKFSYYTDLSVEENLDFIARVYNVQRRRERVDKTLEDFGLVDRRKQLTGSLSGGWKQRVALAACMLHEPELLLLDEPTAGVDPVARRDFWDKIHLLSERGITALVSTHYMDEAERCTRLAYLANGALLITGTVNDVIASAGLYTLELSGSVTTALLQKAKQAKGVVQAELFGNKIHVCAYDKALLDQSMNELARLYRVSVRQIPSTLEDAFISLVQRSGGNIQ